MSKIKAILNDQRLRICSRPLISSGDINTDELEVGFDFNWNFTTPVTFFAAFYRTTPADSVSVPLDETVQGVYSCAIPSEMLSEPGIFTFSVFAKNSAGNIVKTSTECRQKVVQGAYTGAAAYIDWQTFKSDLIELLNNNFSAELSETVTVDEIKTALSNSLFDIIQNVNDKFNAGLTDGANITAVINAINGAISGKDLVQLMNDNLPFNVLNPRSQLFYIDPDNFTTTTVRTALRDYHTLLQNYMDFFQFTINTINNYREADEKYDTQNMTIPQGSTAVWGIIYMIDDLIYWRDLYKERWENAVNELKAEEEKINFDSFSFDSANEMEIHIDEISTDFNTEIDRLREMEVEFNELKAERQRIINNLYNFYTTMENGNGESGSGGEE